MCLRTHLLSPLRTAGMSLGAVPVVMTTLMHVNVMSRYINKDERSAMECVPLISAESELFGMSRTSLTSSSSSEGSRDSGYDGPVDAFSATNLVSSPLRRVVVSSYPIGSFPHSQ